MLVLALALDVGLLISLSQRLIVSDVFKYAVNVSAIYDVGSASLFNMRGALWLVAGLMAIIGVIACLRWHPMMSHRTIGSVFLLTFSGISVSIWMPDPGYILPESHRNVISNNWPNGLFRTYSSEFITKLLVLPATPPVCQSAQPPSIDAFVLVVMESLSLYHSTYLSGLTGMMPEFDKLAQNHAYLDEFHANGYSTDMGLLALVTGQFPITPVDGSSYLDWYQWPTNSRTNAVSQLRDRQVTTQYFGGADLNFAHTGDFLKMLGFDKVEGPNHEFYDGLPKGNFGDPGDENLYRRFLDWFDHERQGRHFSVIQTISTHPPFTVPGIVAQPSEVEAFRYADRALIGLVNSLDQRGFFSHGLLMVTGDHRSMTPRRPGEEASLGEGAVSRLPAIIIGSHTRGIGAIAGRWQQTDVMPSVLTAFGLPLCATRFQGQFLADRPRPAAYVLHTHGIHRDQVMVWEANQLKPAVLRLNGDQTRWLTPPQSTEAASAVANFVTLSRAHRDLTH